MNRRDFFKFLAKGAAIVGVAGVLGLPEIDAKKEYKDILAGKDDGIYFSNNGDIVELGTFDKVISLEEYATALDFGYPISVNDRLRNGTILFGDYISTDNGATWNLLNLDVEDSIIDVKYILNEIQVTTKKGKYFISNDGENFNELISNS